jgi:hypothetical protein
MNKSEFERLNRLSEKALNETATPREIKEFTQFFNHWDSSELNLSDSNIDSPLRDS